MAEDRISIKIDFELVHPKHGSFHDALVIPIEEYKMLSKDDVEGIKMARLEAWAFGIENPPAPPIVDEPTALDLARTSLEEVVAKAQETLAVVAATQEAQVEPEPVPEDDA